jgi:hypothetical protein
MLKRLIMLIVMLSAAVLSQDEVVGTYKKTINTRTQTLVLSSNRNAQLTTEFSGGKTIVQKGTWKVSGELLTLSLTQKNGQKASETIVFQRDGAELVATQYNVKNWGASGIVLERYDPNPQPAAARPVIDTLVVSPARVMKVGEELTVLMTGTPGGQASFEILGAAQDVVLPEVSSGRYQANLKLTSAMVVRDAALVGRLSRDGQEVLKEASRTVTIEGAAPPPAARVELLPRPKSRVFDARPLVGATFSAPVEGAAYRLWLDGAEVTGYSKITENMLHFKPRKDLAQGRHTVRLLGPNVDETWNFTVAGQMRPQVSPADGAQVNTARPELRVRFDQPVQTVTLRLWLDSSEVTGYAQMSSYEIAYQPGFDLTPGTHQARVAARGASGENWDYTWSFQVGGSLAPVGLQLQVTSPTTGQKVPESFVMTGTATPGSIVELTGTVTQPLIPGVIGIKSQNLKYSVYTDPTGGWQLPVAVKAPNGSLLELTVLARDAAGAQSNPVKIRCTIAK